MTQESGNPDVKVASIIALLAYENGKLEEMNRQLMERSFMRKLLTGFAIYVGVAMVVGYTADTLKRRQKEKREKDQVA
jgi:hypothetical protein